MPESEGGQRSWLRGRLVGGGAVMCGRMGVLCDGTGGEGWDERSELQLQLSSMLCELGQVTSLGLGTCEEHGGGNLKTSAFQVKCPVMTENCKSQDGCRHWKREEIPAGEREARQRAGTGASAARRLVEKEEGLSPLPGRDAGGGCSLGLITVPLGPDQPPVGFSKTT